MQAGARLVSAMEAVDRVVGAFVEDIGRAVAKVRQEVAAERELSLGELEAARLAVAQGRQQLERDRASLGFEVEQQQAQLDAAFAELRAEKQRLQQQADEVDRQLRELKNAQAVKSEIERQMGGMLPYAMPSLMQTPMPLQATPLHPGLAMQGAMPAQYANANGAAMAGGGGPAAAEAAPTAAAAAAQGPGEGAGQLYAIGGLEKANSPLHTAEWWQAETQTWRPLPTMSTKRGYCAVAATRNGESIYAVGGSDANTTHHSCEEFNTLKQAWRTVAPMKTQRMWHSAAAIGDNVLALGGYDGSEYLQSCELFEPMAELGEGAGSLGKWVPVADMPTPRSTCGATVLNGTLYAVGGFVAPQYLNVVEAFDPRANSWWGVAPMGESRRDLGVCTIESRNMIVAVGGYDGAAVLGSVEGLDPRMNKWQEFAPMNNPRQLLAVCSKGDTIYAIGGFDGVATCATVESMDMRMNAWREGSHLLTPRLGLGAVAV